MSIRQDQCILQKWISQQNCLIYTLEMLGQTIERVRHYSQSNIRQRRFKEGPPSPNLSALNLESPTVADTTKMHYGLDVVSNL